MNQEQIIVDIATDGSVTVQTRGFKGKSCRDATKQIEQALGTVKSDRSTEEFNESDGPQATRIRG